MRAPLRNPLNLLLLLTVPWLLLRTLRFAWSAFWRTISFLALRRVLRVLQPAPADAAAERRPVPARAQTGSSESRTGLTSFTKALLWLGILLTLFVVGDLVARGFQREIPIPVWEVSEDDPDVGRQAILRHGCGGCHVIPGIRHAVGRVGPQLTDFRNQIYIAGVLPNVPDNLVLWIQDPQSVNPRTAMPNLQVTEAEAREIAVYLYAQP